MSKWTIFSNHGHVLICLSRDPEARLRDVAADVGITERAVQKIVRDLQDADMISVTKVGRRNSYRIHQKQNLRHTLESNSKLKDLIKVINKPGKAGAKQETEPQKVRKAFTEKVEWKPVTHQQPAAPVVSANLVETVKAEKTKTQKPKKKAEKKADQIPKSDKQQGLLF